MTPPMNRRQMLALSGLSLFSACSNRPGTERQTEPNIVIVLADSLRWDHVGCYGQYAVPTPNVDRLAREGVVFERCYSSSSWTKPAIGTLFTGVLPRVHQAVSVEWGDGLVQSATAQKLRPCFATLAECLRDAGYQTAYFLANVIVSTEFGFARGFDRYFPKPSQPVAEQLNNAAGWLTGAAKAPFFAMIHAMNPHFPYTARPSHFERAFGQRPEKAVRDLPDKDRDFFLRYLDNNGKVSKDQGGDPAQMGGLSQAGRDWMRRLYAAEVVELDHWLGRFLGTLEKSDVLDNTLVLFTSDHGEAFGEHGCFYHTNPLFEHQTRVPLVVRPPRPSGGGHRVASPVGLIDIFPTLARLVGAEYPEYLQGTPLPLFDQESGNNKRPPLFCDHQLGGGRTDWDAAVVDGTLKAMIFGDSQPPRAYDLQLDAHEQVNLLEATQISPAAEDLLKRLHGACEAHDELAASFGPPEWVSPSPEATQAIEAMGYL